MNIFSRLLLALLLCVTAAATQAHSFSNAFLSLQVQDNTATGQLQIRLQDVPWLVDLDSNGDTLVTWQELQAGQAALQAAVHEALTFFAGDQSCSQQIGNLQLEQLNTGLFVSLPLTLTCPDRIESLTTNYSLLMKTDTSHRGIVEVHDARHTLTDVFTPERQQIVFDLEAGTPAFSYLSFIEEGIWHIWTGYDHVLFLLALLLPLFLTRKPGLRWTLPTGKQVMRAVLLTVTAFTLAHSITLLLATLLDIQLASAAVETVIAISVALSGLNIIYPVFSRSHATMAFCFGLIHGLGFAGALRDLSLPTQQFVQSLLSFNVGVELGQLALVTLVFPLLWYLRNKQYYQRVLQPLVALGIVSIGLMWAVERSVGV